MFQNILNNCDLVLNFMEFLNEEEFSWICSINSECKAWRLLPYEFLKVKYSMNLKYTSITSLSQLLWVWDFKYVQREELLRQSMQIDNVDMFIHILIELKKKNMKSIDMFEFFLYMINNAKLNYTQIMVEYLDFKIVNNLDILEEVVLGDCANILLILHEKKIFRKKFVHSNFCFVSKYLCKYSLWKIIECLKKLDEIDYIVLLNESFRCNRFANVEIIRWVFKNANSKELRRSLIKFILTENQKWIHTKIDIDLWNDLVENDYLFNLFEDKKELIESVMHEFCTQISNPHYITNINTWHIIVFPLIATKFHKECVEVIENNKSLQSCFTTTVQYARFQSFNVRYLENTKIFLEEIWVLIPWKIRISLIIYIILLVLLYLIEVYFPQ